MARVLVVEDSLTVISSVEALLRQHGHTVYSARDGLIALSALRAFVPEIVLLDILLPHMDGIELCGLIKRQPAYQSVKVVMITSIRDQETVKRAFEAGANHYLSKPFTDEQFYSILEHKDEPPEQTPAAAPGPVL